MVTPSFCRHHNEDKKNKFNKKKNGCSPSKGAGMRAIGKRKGTLISEEINDTTFFFGENSSLPLEFGAPLNYRIDECNLEMNRGASYASYMELCHWDRNIYFMGLFYSLILTPILQLLGVIIEKRNIMDGDYNFQLLCCNNNDDISTKTFI